MLGYIIWGVRAVGGLLRFITPTDSDDARTAAKNRLDAATRELRDGEAVTLTGVVRMDEELLESPFAGASCVFWSAHVRLFEKRGRHRQLVDELHESKVVPFILETSHGSVRVEGEQAETELVPRAVVPRQLERDRDFIAAHGYSGAYVRGGGFDEVAIAPGQRISVHGVLMLERALAGDAGYRDEAVRIRLVDHPAHRLTLGKPR